MWVTDVLTTLLPPPSPWEPSRTAGPLEPDVSALTLCPRRAELMEFVLKVP